MNKDENRGSKNYIESHAIRVCSFYTRRRVYSSYTKSSIFCEMIISVFFEKEFVSFEIETKISSLTYSAVMH